MTKLPTAAVIGAGSSGIAALKALHERGIDVECFETSNRVGGNWVFGNKNGMSAAYRFLHINTSRERMQYSDFPMPTSYPDFPRHDQIAEYFDAYVDHFGIRDRISFENGVERAERLPDGTWELATRRGGTRRFDMLVVANGHHWDKRWPEPAFPGADAFRGVQMHAHDYVDNEDLKGKDVVVLGMGNSAMDISVEASYVARNTYLAARRGAWIVPKYVAGKPVDREHPILTAGWLPFRVRQVFGQLMLKASHGNPEEYGLPKPDHKFGQAHPTVSGRILDRIAHGTITPRPNIARLHADEVEFTDGTRVHADVVVYCTGYKITFPFFDEELVSAPDNSISLYQRVFHPDLTDLSFIGLVQPLGAVMPLAEEQGRLVADQLTGRYALPSRAAMAASIAADEAEIRSRYIGSKRHTIQVDFERYLHQLRQERAAGAKRAAAGRVAVTA